MKQKSVSLRSLAKNKSFPFENLPADIQKKIVSYFDIQTLSFFATTSKKHLVYALPFLKECQKELSTLTVGSYSMSSYVHHAQKLFACGHNVHGQLGLGDTQNRPSFTEVKNISGTILQVAAGASHAFVLTDQELWACGDNSFGQLGLGDYKNRALFTKIEPIPGKILQINAGYACTLVLTDEGVWVCGNSFLVDDSKDLNSRNKFTKVKNIPGKILRLATSNNHIFTDEGLWTYGYNSLGSLGLGHYAGQGSNKACPLTKIENIPDKIVQVISGGGHTFILTDQKLWVCGANHCGQLGLGLKLGKKCSMLKEVKNIPGKILHVAAGREYAVILTTEGMWVCGSNDYGQLGLGDTQPRSLFTRVENIPDKILQVSAGANHLMVLTPQGIWACGGNFRGQLGLANDRQSYPTLTRVENLLPEATQEKHFSSSSSILKMYRYISKLEDLESFIVQPPAIKAEEHSVFDSISRPSPNPKRNNCQIS